MDRFVLRRVIARAVGVTVISGLMAAMVVVAPSSAAGDPTGAGAISGTVTWPTGQMRPGTEPRVSAYREGGGGSWQQPEVDPSGSYTLTGLEPGAYVVTFFESDDVYAQQRYGGESFETAQRIEVGTETVSGIDFDAKYTGGIAGRITDSRGVDLQTGTFWVQILDSLGNEVDIKRIRDDGTYEIWGLATGEYRVLIMDWNHNFFYEYYGESETPEGAAPVNVEYGNLTENIDVALDFGAVAKVSLRGPGGEPIDKNSWILMTGHDASGAPAGGTQSGNKATLEQNGFRTGMHRFEFFDSACLYKRAYSGGAETFPASDFVSLELGQILDMGVIELSRSNGICAPDHSPDAIPKAVVGADGVSVSWAEPPPSQFDGGKVSGYTVESQPFGVGCKTTGARSCVATGATPGVDYRFFVSATNDGGAAMPSPASNVVRAPNPIPEPQREAALNKQHMKKWPKRVRVGNKKSLRVRTDAGVKVRWTSKTPRVCSVRKGKVYGLWPGKCQLKSVAKSKRGYARYKEVNVLRVR